MLHFSVAFFYQRPPQQLKKRSYIMIPIPLTIALITAVTTPLVLLAYYPISALLAPSVDMAGSLIAAVVVMFTAWKVGLKKVVLNTSDNLVNHGPKGLMPDYLAHTRLELGSAETSQPKRQPHRPPFLILKILSTNSFPYLLLSSSPEAPLSSEHLLFCKPELRQVYLPLSYLRGPQSQ